MLKMFLRLKWQYQFPGLMNEIIDLDPNGSGNLNKIWFISSMMKRCLQCQSVASTSPGPIGGEDFFDREWNDISALFSFNNYLSPLLLYLLNHPILLTKPLIKLLPVNGNIAR